MMNKLLSCGPLKLERLLIWTRGQSNRDTQRWTLKENDEQKGYIIVELIKGKNQSLGLTISGGTDKPTPPVVANVRSGGLADQSDYFSVGDLILEINEKDVTKLRHSEIIKFIQESGKHLCFKMQYKKLFGADSVNKSTTLNLCKESNEMKFTLRGGRSKDGLVNRPITVADIKQDSEIARSGAILEGDIVLAIDNRSIDNLHISEIKSILKDLRNDYTMKIQFNVDKKELKESERGSVMVEISRPFESMHPGLRLDVSLDNEQFGSIVSVSEIKESGLASRTGAITSGDIVLAINGISMDGMSVDQARKMMDTSGKTIQFEMLPSDQPSSSQQLQGSRNDFLQLLAKEKMSDNEHKTRTLSLTRPTLRQYPSKSSLSSLKRLNSTDRNLSSTKSQEMQNPFPNYRSIKRGVSSNPRFGTLDDTRSLMSNCSTLSQCNIGNMVSKIEVTSLVLIAEDSDFGIEVQDGMNGYDMSCIILRSIVGGKAADRSGVLQVGDRILSINGIRTEFMTSEEFHRVVYESGTSLRMEIEFDVTDAIVPSSGTFTVKIPRSENTGIILAETNSEDRERYLRVVDIKKASVAYRMGILAAGDQIVHINGAQTSNLSLYEANEMIRKCYDVMKITVKKDEEIQGNSFGVEFNRRGEQLGITISGSEEPFDPIYITSIIEGSIAGRSGAVRVGDRLLAINEITLRGKPLWKAFELLRTAGDIVKLLIKREVSSMSCKQSVEKEFASDSCEMAPLSRDVQQWVLNSTNLEDITEKDRCPTSQGSASTESYCDISDSPSSTSDFNPSTKKRVAKRPVLPAWQRECLKNYENDSQEKYDEFTRSEIVSKLDDAPLTYSKIDSRCASDAQLHSLFRPVDVMDTSEEAFNWDQALSTGRKDRILYDDQCQFDSDNELRGASFAIGSSDRCFEEDVCVSPPIFSASEYRLTPTLPALSASGVLHKSTRDEFKKDSRFHFEKEAVKDVEGKERIRYPGKEPMSLELTRKKNRSFDFPKSKLRGQNAGGGLLQAVAYFENLDKGTPSEKSFGRSSLKSVKVRDDNDSKKYDTQPFLSVSPFQLAMSSKSDKYLRELERKAQAQYKDIKDKLGESSLESIDTTKLDSADDVTAVVSAPKHDKLSVTDSGYSTSGIRGNKTGKDELKSENALIASRAKFVAKPGGDDGLNCGDNTRATTHRIVVTKNEFDQDFGFSISERIDGQGIYVKSIQASTGRSGKLKKYDRILQVNGINTRELTCDEVIPLLQRAGRRLQLVVERVQKGGCP